MKISQKIMNAIILAILALFGYNEVDPILPSAATETVYAKQAPAPGTNQPTLETAVVDGPTFVDGDYEPKTTWYCWLSYWVPNRQECADFAPANCKNYSWYAHPNRISMVQESRPTKEDFVFTNGLYIPPQLKNVPGIDPGEIELAFVYAVKVSGAVEMK